ncbi:uncharacterized protein L3040_004358 [Drepanopeziza brunnea f. sp. 'multigermtubi']|uniref:uncharacterized protein n=1 Tax=Drepanopeziza brunnea f. sp. 'multigermtubi' TaxID=698441 RepID=UPI00238B83EF|nr:hypothetical protein L3040_004358 [Drepanopeziza brunnea f. sp. 'multigermtubi']
MLSLVLYIAALLSLVQGHGVILGAQGEAGSPPSVGFQVNDAIARNCTSISPCQQDTTIIRDAEIRANIVNECGRTELTGNIDIGENTENALAAGAVTSVKSGTLMTVTIHQVNADGAGPYACDLEETGNTGVFTQNLTVTNNVPGVNGFSQAKTQDFNITVAMPDEFNCIGGSTGNICTVRCRNNSQAGPFGGCVAVQQTDGVASVNSPNTISTAATLPNILAQVNQDQIDLAAAIKANQVSGTGAAALKAAGAELKVVSKAAEVQTLARENINGVGAAAATTGAADSVSSSASAKATETAKGAGKGARKGAAKPSAATMAKETGAVTKGNKVAGDNQGSDGNNVKNQSV